MNVPPFLSASAERVERALEKHFSQLSFTTHKQILVDAIRYSTLGGGKRIRAALVYAAAESTATTLPVQALDDIACAVEMIHAYSLIHDDLPAMDNDQYRRGNPACHIKYGEAVAILAGNTLQVYAFEMLSNSETIPAQDRLSMINAVAKAIGVDGMAGGQAMDMLAVEQDTISPHYVKETHRAKTAQLIKACILMGACGSANSQQLVALKTFSEDIGLGFQIQDDLLDSEVECTQAQDKKTIAPEKASYPHVFGIASSQKQLKSLHQSALRALEPYPDAQPLRVLANYMVGRDQ